MNEAMRRIRFNIIGSVDSTPSALGTRKIKDRSHITRSILTASMRIKSRTTSKKCTLKDCVPSKCITVLKDIIFMICWRLLEGGKAFQRVNYYRLKLPCKLSALHVGRNMCIITVDSPHWSRKIEQNNAVREIAMQ